MPSDVDAVALVVHHPGDASNVVALLEDDGFLIPVRVSSSNAAVSPAGPAPMMIARSWSPEVMSYQIVPDWESNPVVSLVPWFRAWARLYRARTILAPVHGAPDQAK